MGDVVRFPPRQFDLTGDMARAVEQSYKDRKRRGASRSPTMISLDLGGANEALVKWIVREKFHPRAAAWFKAREEA